MPPSNSNPPADPAALTRGTVLHTWWPLAASWLLMGLEMPMVVAVMSRMADAEVQLAALGGIVFPLALMIESPIIMMLAASTALSTDRQSFAYLKRFMTILSIALTVAHVLLAFTPLYDVVVGDILGVPATTLEAGRTGMRIMLPWSWAIADRRFHQGVMIRFGFQRHVGIGTLMRLVAMSSTLLVGAITEFGSGIVVATTAIAIGVLTEMFYARLVIRPVIAGPVQDAPARSEPLAMPHLLKFYIPLALTPLLALMAQPIGSAGISRMPDPLVSLAIWPALNGFAFMTRSIGVAYNEVTVRHAHEPDSARMLGRLAWILGGTTSLLVIAMAVSPLGEAWFRVVMGLDLALSPVAHAGLWFACPLPLLTFLHSYYQGLLVGAHATRGITEATGVFIVVTGIALWCGVMTPEFLPGSSMAMAALSIGGVAQVLWLHLRWTHIR